MKVAHDKHSDPADIPRAQVSRQPKFSLVWVVPLIALCIAGWLVWDELRQRGPVLKITFADGSGLQEGKTSIKFKGVQIGSITDVSLNPDLKGVVVTVMLDRSAATLAREDSLFWVVRPEIGFSGVHGLDTLLSGQYLTVRPGQGAPATTFTGLAEPPPPGPDRPGINLILQTTQLGGLTTGAPVYYRDFEVGVVDRMKLADDAGSVLIHIHVNHPYDALVRENTQFWNASGIGVHLGLLGLKVKTESLKAILEGGVAFATPNNAAMGGKPQNLAVYTLHDKPEDDWLKWQPDINLDADGKEDASTAEGYFPPPGKTPEHEPEKEDPRGKAPVALPHGPGRH